MIPAPEPSERQPEPGTKARLAATHVWQRMECPHLAYITLQGERRETLDDTTGALLRRKGYEHEQRVLAELRATHKRVVEVDSNAFLFDRRERTLQALRAGPPVIYQAALRHEQWHGFADFLLRVEQPSTLGDWSYEVADTKLGTTPKPAHVLQLCVYSRLLEQVQDRTPEFMHLILGDGRWASYRYDDFSRYARAQEKSLEDFDATQTEAPYPVPCSHCSICTQLPHCEARWETDDHLSRVATMRTAWAKQISEQGLRTVADLANAPQPPKLRNMATATAQRLHRQAQMQYAARTSGKPSFELLPPGDERGLARLPQPDAGDLFFDMEGDPFYPDGLEYLFGFVRVQDGEPVFTSFWAHDRDQERTAFAAAMDFMANHLKQHPQAHIYHYNHYEETACKRLASRHATHEAAFDTLLREQRFVDLYRVVRESLQTSQPNLSLKSLEVFYGRERFEPVSSAMDSVVAYEQYLETGDESRLEDIERYNEVDCRSTWELRKWLVSLRAPDIPWRLLPATTQERQEKWQEQESARQAYEEALLEECDPEERPWRSLLADLLGFHRREEKPEWWAQFDRQEKSHEDLVDDAECLGNLTLDADAPVGSIDRSRLYTYTFPPQDTKLKVGSDALLRSFESAGTIHQLDSDLGRVVIKRGANRDALPGRLSLLPRGPIGNRVLAEAIYRVAASVIAGDGKFAAVEALLRRTSPLSNQQLQPQATDDRNPYILDLATQMDGGVLFLQGPPGAGKTYTASHVIVGLMAQGYRVGVSSNSHKAIHNLLTAVESVAAEQDLTFSGVKKATAGKEGSHFEGRCIRSVTDNGKVGRQAQLLAGTAWLFARAQHEQALDYLFVDEAGQVSLANLVAMGTAAQNLVLVGDQMQLSQPIRGAHPGNSGLSALDHLLQGRAVIEPSRGVFLDTTWRMHPSVCRFISEAVYEGKLRSHADNDRQQIILNGSAHPQLLSHGIRFLPVEHVGCSQRSDEEAEVLAELYDSLLEQSFSDRNGQISILTPYDILVVTPYNVQANALAQQLPAGARVGTVDKFQGQEAPVVLVSMCTSGSEDLPRNVEFLYSTNRLNVAISRARSLAVVLASPGLLKLPCRTVEQMRMVNTMHWLAEAGSTPA